LISHGSADTGFIGFHDANIDSIASHFHCYSTDDLRCLDKEMLHNLLVSHSLQVETEDHLLESLIDLGSDYFEFWSYIEVSHLTRSGFLRFVQEIPFHALTTDIWSTFVELHIRGPKESCLSLRYFAHPLPAESTILREVPKAINEFSLTKWECLYRGTTDGFASSDFHGKCNGQMNTLTIILTTTGFIFGGFTPIAWDSSGTYKTDNSQKSFLFSVKNRRNSPSRKFALLNCPDAIHCQSGYGPMFGNSYTRLGTAYLNDTCLSGQEVLAGEMNFTVKEIEVFAICD
jgi:hypothetical protein